MLPVNATIRFTSAIPAQRISALQQRILQKLDGRSFAAFGLPFALYLATCAPTVYNLDSAELTTAAVTLGITRATGYPLYILLGHVWSWLPLGDAGFRLNLFSAFCGAVTVALADRILRRMGVGPWATVGALGLLTVGKFFWGLSLIAEVYTLHTALMASAILLAMRWVERPTAGRLVALALVLAASMGNHAATVLLLPGIALYLVMVGHRAESARRNLLSPRTLGLAACAGLVGLSVYLYLPLRSIARPAFNYAGMYNASGVFEPVDLATLQGFWWLVSGRAFAGLMFDIRGMEWWRDVGAHGVGLVRAFFAIGIGPGLLGLVLFFRRDKPLAAMLLAMFALNMAFYAGYRVGDKVTMYLPTYLIWALWLGLGYQVLIDWLRSAADPWVQRWGTYLVQCILVLAVLVAGLWNLRLVNLSADHSARQVGEKILDEVPANALVLGSWDTVPPIEYLQLVEGRRQDVLAINRFLIAQEDMERLIADSVALRPVFIDSVPSSLFRFVEAEPAGALYRLRERPIPEL
ncbi:MAG: protein O-mannosyl-transferase family [Anaerolineae bacterium]